MRIKLDLILALLVAVPCLIAAVKASDAKSRIVPVLALIAAVVAVAVQPIERQFGSVPHLDAIAWAATGVLAVIAGVRLGEAVSTTLVITGGVLGALLHFGIVAA